ncbi:unnamed protein product [Brachionus calyciflorus]|uniref:Uncharacterized protein n=1 Tax=Brachionus calyciflorus TaxID=104777 RepID=A0A814JR31_9BILA|nr:unnamed protein product [Brachionus calyciflorus]
MIRLRNSKKNKNLVKASRYNKKYTRSNAMARFVYVDKKLYEQNYIYQSNPNSNKQKPLLKLYTIEKVENKSFFKTLDPDAKRKTTYLSYVDFCLNEPLDGPNENLRTIGNWESSLKIECKERNIFEQYFGGGYKKNKSLVSVKQSFLANTRLETPKSLKRKRDSSKDRDVTGEIDTDALLSDLNDQSFESEIELGNFNLSPIRTLNDPLNSTECSEGDIIRTALFDSFVYDIGEKFEKTPKNVIHGGKSSITINFKIEDDQLLFNINWKLHPNFAPEYFKSTYEPFENVYGTATESIAEMVEYLDDNDEKIFIDWMRRKKPKELEEILNLKNK